MLLINVTYNFLQHIVDVPFNEADFVIPEDEWEADWWDGKDDISSTHKFCNRHSYNYVQRMRTIATHHKYAIRSLLLLKLMVSTSLHVNSFISILYNLM